MGFENGDRIVSFADGFAEFENGDWIGTLEEFKPDLTAMMLTAGLAAVHFGSKKFLKKGLSPIGLIVLSALAGILIYGLH